MYDAAVLAAAALAARVGSAAATAATVAAAAERKRVMCAWPSCLYARPVHTALHVHDMNTYIRLWNRAHTRLDCAYAISALAHAREAGPPPVAPAHHQLNLPLPGLIRG